MTKTIVTVAACATLLWVGAALARPGCISKRADAAGKYLKCVQHWQSKLFAGGVAVGKESKCREKYAAAWDKMVTLNTAPCSGSRWVDNGTTVTDNLTGLIWEKKTDDGGVNDWDNTYTWTNGDADPTDEDGTAFTVFLSSLNSGGGFAGASGWRLPTVAELLTIPLPEPYPCTTNPCIDPVFGPTKSGNGYFTATTNPGIPDFVWGVSFGDCGLGGCVGTNTKALSGAYVRAVRGGL